jgi:hypothetical protein
MANGVRSRVRSCWICGFRCGTGTVSLCVIRFPLLILILSTSPHVMSQPMWYITSTEGRLTKGLCLTLPHEVSNRNSAKHSNVKLIPLKATKITNSMAVVRERTIPTERPPLVIEISVNFSEQRASRGQRDGSLRPYSRFSRPELLLFLPSSSSVVLTRLSGPRSRPTTSQKI